MSSIILASASPRRSDILKMLGVDFTVMTSDAEEKATDYMGSCVEKAMDLSKLKALDVAERFRKENAITDALVIGADTIVTLDINHTEVLEKPRDKEDAYRMLRVLSGKKHYVVTGVTVVNLKDKTVKTDYELTAVHMSDLSDDDIYMYINTGEPWDKAGAYGIQGLGSLLVKSIEGCYFNVVGLPVQLTARMLKENGYDIKKGWGV
jgi:septum formation protein